MGPAADAWKIRFLGLIRFPVQRIGTESSGRNLMLMQVDVFSICAYIKKINNPMERCIQSMRILLSSGNPLLRAALSLSLSLLIIRHFLDPLVHRKNST